VTACSEQGLEALLYGVRPQDAESFGVAGGALIAVTAVAASLPARCAARIDPVTTLRE
jgi:hypothetical protein